MIDDAVQLGLVYHSWPFSRPPGAMPGRTLRYLMERTVALTPQPPPPDEADPDV